MKNKRPLIAFLALVTTANVQANEDIHSNVKLWEGKAIEVSNFSVIQKPKTCKHPQLTFQESTVLTVIDQIRVLNEFNFQESPDQKYWIIQTSTSCTAANKLDCLNSKVSAVQATTKAVVSCWKYRGLTVSLGKDGGPSFDSDIPAEKKIIGTLNN